MQQWRKQSGYATLFKNLGDARLPACSILDATVGITSLSELIDIPEPTGVRFARSQLQTRFALRQLGPGYIHILNHHSPL